MKNFHKFLALTLLLCSAMVMMVSCSSDEEDYSGSPIVGTWANNNAKYTFKKNGKGTMAIIYGSKEDEVISISYKYNEEKSTLKIKEENDDAREYHVDELTEDRLVLDKIVFWRVD